MAYGRPRPDPVGEGQESVWDYPRPPALVRSDRHVLIRLADTVIAETRRVSPIACTRNADLRMREPSPRPVLPSSPVRVPIFDRRLPMSRT